MNRNNIYDTLKRAHEKVKCYKNIYVGGMIEWSNYLKNKRIYKNENKKDYFTRISSMYYADLRNEKLLNSLDRIENNLKTIIEKIENGIPVSRDSIISHVQAVETLPPIPPPPPLPHMLIQDSNNQEQYIRQPKKVLSESEKEEIKKKKEAIDIRQKLIDELKETIERRSRKNLSQ